MAERSEIRFEINDLQEAGQNTGGTTSRISKESNYGYKKAL